MDEIKLLLLLVMCNLNIQELHKLFLVTELVFGKKMSLKSFKFLYIMLMKDRNNIINIEEDDNSAVCKIARFIKNKYKT